MHKRIGLYGGSFDPVHAGHNSIAQSFLGSEIIDELWILLTPVSPHKGLSNPADYSHRLNMLRIAFQNMEKVQILTIETELPKPNYTFKTIEYLKRQYADYSFFYCMGGDSLMNFHTWKHPEKILEHTSLLIAIRPGSNYDKVDKYIMNKSYFVDHQPIDVSSTGIKNCITGNKSIVGLVDQEVESYIRTHKLYLSN